MIKLNVTGLNNIVYEDNRVIIKSDQSGKIVLLWQEETINIIDLIIEENVHLELIELGEKENSQIRINIGKNSNVKYNIFTRETAFDSSKEFSLFEGAYLLVAYADFSQGRKKVNAKINLKENNSEVDWHLASLTQKDDKKIYNVDIIHEVGLTRANMENYGVCKETSTLEFLGDATIEKGSKKASTKQTAKIVVFDEKCHAKASPKLCIYENDVEASHGASEGQINPDHIYYLMSRGLSEEEAKRLITLGYLNPIMTYFSDENLKEQILNSIVKEI